MPAEYRTLEERGAIGLRLYRLHPVRALPLYTVLPFCLAAEAAPESFQSAHGGEDAVVRRAEAVEVLKGPTPALRCQVEKASAPVWEDAIQNRLSERIGPLGIALVEGDLVADPPCRVVDVAAARESGAVERTSRCGGARARRLRRRCSASCATQVVRCGRHSVHDFDRAAQAAEVALGVETIPTDLLIVRTGFALRPRATPIPPARFIRSKSGGDLQLWRPRIAARRAARSRAAWSRW